MSEPDDPSVPPAGRSWWGVRLNPDDPPFNVPRATRTLVAYISGVLLFAFLALLIEWASGAPLAPAQSAAVERNAADAVWHLATAFLLVLPTRHRVLIGVTPLLALGLDADHLFGTIAPTVLHRESHDFLFVAIVAATLWVLVGRAGALAATAGVFAHIAVDGGTFPLLAPVSLGMFALPWWASVAMLGLAATLLVLAVRPPTDLRRPRFAIPIALVVLAVTLFQWIVPGIGLFNPA